MAILSKFPGSRHRRFMMTGCAAAIMLATSAGGVASDRAPEKVEARESQAPIMVIAHRGGAMLRPENTLPAFQRAVELDVEMLEFDMEMTADDRIVIYHDATINPDFCTPIAGATVTPGPVRGLSFAQTQKFDCGSGVRPSYAGPQHITVPGAHIPSLDEVLEGFKDSAALFFAETKIPKPAPGVADIDPVKFATLLDAAVRKYGLEDRLILQSFDFRTIDALHRINPRIRTCLLGAQNLTKDYLALLRQHHASCIVLSHADTDAAGVRLLQDAGILVFSGVVDTADDWQTYADLGVNAIFTNEPEGLIGFLKQAGLRQGPR